MRNTYSKRYSRTSGSIAIAFYILLIVIIAIITVGTVVGSIWRKVDKTVNKYEVEATVTDKDVKNSSESSKYLVFTKDDSGEVHVFEVTDNLFAGRFNSSDTYAQIEIGQKYKFTVGGKRVPLFSWYPNIYDFEEIK